ncbi:hypothetical protein OG302_03775 [Streptomyces sp. NBC_01283]|uniref:hypothetical protein n=1 Tax=Streptomyces sp. NBC_01283 TaxID=2903812 RepID=UPI00352D4F3C|nr:hypothetical protein OG302_03775 [Streptomyces sp. NBC_01283]
MVFDRLADFGPRVEEDHARHVEEAGGIRDSLPFGAKQTYSPLPIRCHAGAHGLFVVTAAAVGPATGRT